MKDRKIVKGICFFILLLCLAQLGYGWWKSDVHQKQQEALVSLQEGTVKARKEGSGPAASEAGGTQPGVAQGMRTLLLASVENTEAMLPAVLDQFTALYAENQDLVGWLSIEGMRIDYPVMQCEDDEYYLHHDFYGKEDKYGCLYVKEAADLFTPDTNFIVYGHNMRDGSMFGDLDLYREKEFYEQHSQISFDTLYERRTYEIVSVFLSQVYSEEEGVFKYYRFRQAETEEEFADYYENIKKLALYDTGVTAEFGDTFLTLSTCAYHVEGGRLVVTAKRIA